jgi:hypothetical protein
LPPAKAIKGRAGKKYYDEKVIRDTIKKLVNGVLDSPVSKAPAFDRRLANMRNIKERVS